MTLTLAKLLGGTYVERKPFNFDDGVKRYGQPNSLQIKIAGLVLGRNAALAAQVPKIEATQFFTSSGVPYAGQEIIDYRRVQLQISEVCGAGLSAWARPGILPAISYTIGRRRADLAKAILGLS